MGAGVAAGELLYCDDHAGDAAADPRECERTGRCCYGIELDPIYVDTAVKRWERYTGDHAVDAVSGKRFDDLSNEKRIGRHEEER